MLRKHGQFMVDFQSMNWCYFEAQFWGHNRGMIRNDSKWFERWFEMIRNLILVDFTNCFEHFWKYDSKWFEMIRTMIRNDSNEIRSDFWAHFPGHFGCHFRASFGSQNETCFQRHHRAYLCLRMWYIWDAWICFISASNLMPPYDDVACIVHALSHMQFALSLLEWISPCSWSWMVVSHSRQHH